MANVGSADRIIRLVAGLALLVVGLLPLAGVEILAGLGSWHWLVALVGVVLLATGLTRSCPAYSLLGVSTARRTAAPR